MCTHRIQRYSVNMRISPSDSLYTFRRRMQSTAFMVFIFFNIFIQCANWRTNVFIRFIFFVCVLKSANLGLHFFFRYSNAEQSWIWNEHDTSGPINNNWIPQGSFFYVSNSYTLVRSIYAFISKLLRCMFFSCVLSLNTTKWTPPTGFSFPLSLSFIVFV